MIVGVDIGTQSLKAVVTDSALAVRGRAAIGYRAEFPRPGWAEQDPLLWERALGKAVSAALTDAGAVPHDVTAIGLAGQLDGCVAVDDHSQPMAPALIWMDRRAQAEIGRIDADRVRRMSGVVLDATHMAAKIAWLKRYLPGRACRYHQPVSYLVARLTGEHIFDHGLASTTMLYSLAERRFDPGLLEQFDIEMGELPRISDAASPAGLLTDSGAALSGLPSGITVAVGTGDDFSSPLGAGLTRPGRVACTLGTAEVVGALHAAPAIDAGALVETHAYPGGLYFIENPGWLSGGALEWAVGILGLTGVTELDRLAANAPPGAGTLTFLPALSGAMAPEWIASARGAWYGLTPAHTSAHLARSVLEGCAFAMRDVIERLAEMSVPVNSILLLGGGAKSALWARIRADVTGLGIDVPALLDSSPLGAAMLAAVAAGLQPTLATAATLIGGGMRRIAPQPGNLAVYDEAHARYRRLFEALRPMYGGSECG